jgi:hypothetical protein
MNMREHLIFNRCGSDLAGSRSHQSFSSPPGAGDWRAVCGKSARTVRREGRPERAVPTPIESSHLALLRDGAIQERSTEHAAEMVRAMAA